MSDTQDARIVAEVLNGDVDAYGTLMVKYQKPVYNLMLRLTGSRSEAVELTQDTFTRAYERLEQYRSRHRFFTWLYTIGMNMARDWARKRRPELVDYDLERHASRTPDHEEVLGQEQEKGALRQALARLPLDYREAVLLHYRDGLPMKDIAVILKFSTSGAKMRVNRGVGMLREILAEKGHETR